MKKKRLVLIDGSAYIFRAYYALPPMQRKDGTPVNALFGFTNMLVKLIEDYSVDKMLVVFDAARKLTAIEVLRSADFGTLIVSGTDRIQLMQKIESWSMEVENTLDSLRAFEVF